MLKQVTYGWGEPTPSGKSGVAVYVIDKGVCVYSGINWPATSTINGAEGLVRAIVEAEGVKLDELTFYDLRTSMGYPDLHPGQYELLKAIFTPDGERHEVRWERARLEPGLLQPFLPYITGTGANN